MLEGIVQPRHLDELDRSVEVMSEPQLFEVRDMTQIPDDGTHQRIVLKPEILVAERRDQQKCPFACLEELLGEDAAEGFSGIGDRGQRPLQSSRAQCLPGRLCPMIWSIFGVREVAGRQTPKRLGNAEGG